MRLEERLGGRRRLYWAAAALAAVVIIGLWIALRPSPKGPGAAPSIPVVATPAKIDNMPVIYDALGTVTPLASVTVRTQISGQLVAVGFTEGQEVQAGAFLAQIDPRPYQAALDQAQGQLARDQAQLAGARVDLARYALLMRQDSIAKQTYDDQASTVRQFEGTVKLDEAAVETARVNLSYCHIVAPVAGRVGLRQVDPGNYVTPSDTNGIVVLNQMRPISVLFSLPEDDLEAVLKGSRGNAKLPVAAYDRTGATKLAEGTLQSIDNTVNTSTGTFELRAAFANENETLFPNQFVNVQIMVDVLKNVVVIPSAAIQRGAPGTFVYVVNQDNTVSVRPVTLGPSAAENVATLKGLQANERVVVDGADKLKEGAKVVLRPPAAIGVSSAPPGGVSPRSTAAPARQ
ncbi:MAG: MdtA/MuxA family multidrug efflux RND transporter periplasmic adaptor subunit [Alphaproteobacteria bacterium]|nr:MdtA/MuxA family multidrug efflux RND transporter periplasmic adaptor subunit [Alphaproteobacteria bacterium]